MLIEQCLVDHVVTILTLSCCAVFAICCQMYIHVSPSTHLIAKNIGTFLAKVRAFSFEMVFVVTHFPCNYEHVTTMFNEIHEHLPCQEHEVE